MKPHYTIVLLLASVPTLSAQTVPPALMVQQDGRSVPLGLAKLQTEVRIFGSVAETTTTMTFANPSARPMEGDLYFPLPEGATVSGYALDINGRMVDGVAVEKHEARRVFEEVVRHGIDPGLVQWTQGNNFQTRVFPIPAHGSRTVRVSYVTELLGGKEAPAYHLPLKFKDKIHEFALRMEVVKPAAPPKVAKGEMANFAFEKWRDSYVAETRQQDWSPIEDLVIALPKADGPQVVVEKADDGQVYFAIQGYSTRAESDAQRPVLAPWRVVVFWDASGSRAGDHKREIAVLGRYLAALLPVKSAGVEPKIAVDLVLIRNAASKPIRVEFSKSDGSALAAELDKVQYDGGTQLGVIAPLGGDHTPDLYLLFTDGISNFGREEPAKLDAPLVIFSADAGAKHVLLHALAMGNGLSNGGRYINLAVWKDADIIAQVGHPVWSLLSPQIEYGGATDVYPQQPEPLAGCFTVVGRLVGEQARVWVSQGNAGRAQTTVFEVSRADAVEGSLLRCLWAQKKLVHLMIHQKANEKEIAALGKQFGLVTPYTSLLVLDSVEQHVQYEIVPPKSLAAMREEYMRRIDTLEHQKQKEKADKLAEVVRMWEQRVKWWNAEYKYAKDFKYCGEQEDRAGVLSVTPAAPAAEPDPALAMPAPRPALAPARSRADAHAVPDEPKPEMPKRDAMAPSRDEQGTSPAKAGEGTEIAQGSQVGRQPGIVIRPWQPDMPYLKDLQGAKGKAALFAVYMKNRVKYGDSPAFFLDCADFFREAGDSELALQILSNIAEMELEDATLLRVLGYRLLQIGQLDLAVQTFEHVLELRPEEPQSYRDLALALARRAEEDRKFLDDAEQARKAPDYAMRPNVTLFNGTQTFVAKMPDAESVRVDYARAIDLLVQVVMRPWDARFPEIEVIALEEVNRIIPRAKAAGVSVVPLDPRLIKLRLHPGLWAGRIPGPPGGPGDVQDRRQLLRQPGYAAFGTRDRAGGRADQLRPSQRTAEVAHAPLERSPGDRADRRDRVLTARCFQIRAEPDLQEARQAKSVV